MKRNVMAIATGMMLLVAGIASAAPKSETVPNATTETKVKAEGKTCTAGEGREFVDKNASLYTSECEIGNAAFFASYTGKKAGRAKTAAMAGGCCATDAKTAKTVATGEACSPGDACCEVGNAGFFANSTCCGGQHAKMHGKKMKIEKKAKESATR
jgi:hypothetical protein